MKIAIHHSENSFSTDWIEYCQRESIPFQIVNCYRNDIIKQLKNCDGLMWHYHQSNSKDVLFAKQLLYSVQIGGKKVFPNFNTSWHFDDKIGQKYLLESIEAPFVPTYVFYDKNKAYNWVENAQFPKVFKLRRGAGSAHVQLVKNKTVARSLIRKAFGRGFSQYNAISNLKERWRKFKRKQIGLKSLLKGVIRLGYTTKFNRVIGREKGYIYFQDFIPDNNFDVRVIVIDGKAFAIRREVRENDFRASGSGILSFSKEYFSEEMIGIAFKLSKKLKTQSIAVDLVKENNDYLILEISYGFPATGFTDGCEGYWDQEMNWYPGSFNEKYWMVESLINEINGNT